MEMIFNYTNDYPVIAFAIITGVVIFSTEYIVEEYFIRPRWIADKGVQTLDQTIPKKLGIRNNSNQFFWGGVNENIQTVCQTSLGVNEEIQTVNSTIVNEGVQTVDSSLIEVEIQTESLPSYTQAIDSIAEYPNLDIPVMEPTVIIQPNLITHREMGVQTSSESLFQIFKSWFRNFFNLDSETANDLLDKQSRIINWTKNVESNYDSMATNDIPQLTNNIQQSFVDLTPFDSISNMSNSSSVTSLANSSSLANSTSLANSSSLGEIINNFT